MKKMRSSNTNNTNNNKGGGGGGVGGSGKGKKRKVEDDEDLVDAARALAAFSKQVRFVDDEEDTRLRFAMKLLCWGGKRKRSSIAHTTRPASSSSNMRVVSNSAVDFPLVKEEEQEEEYSEGDKGDMSVPVVAYNRFDTGSEDSLPGSRAESPNSPLPPLGTEATLAYVKTELGVKRRLTAEEKALKRQRATKEPKLEDVKFNGSDGKPRRPSGRGRCNRVALTEEEKEMRRLRRIEANRESARQTIRKKQKMCEEMTTRVTELTCGNEQYRKDITAVRDEIERLQEMNCSLRSQLAVCNMNFPTTSGSDVSSTVDAATANPIPEQSSCSGGLKESEEPVIKVQLNREDDIDLVEFSPPRVTSKREQSTTPCSKMKSSHTAGSQLPVTVVARAYFSTPRHQPGPLQPGMYPYLTDKQIFAEARRRRRELQQTKAKNIYARQAILNS